ncbi:MAG: DUF2934 domain-containing protein [Pseudomonadota bacterium]
MNIQHHRIREYAYQIWQSEGMPEGQDQRHWEMACKLANGNGPATPEDASAVECGTVTFEDNLDQSAQTQAATIEPLKQLNPDQPFHPTEPVKSLIDTGPIAEPLVAQVKNVEPQKIVKPKKLKASLKTSEKLSENESI